MSIISDRHSVVPFIAGKSVAFETQRLAKIGYKSSKNKPAEFPSVCVSIPVLADWTENQNLRLRPYIVQFVQDTQDKVIRSLYESSAGSLQSIGNDEINMEQILSFLAAESTGDRLTKEKIHAWFDSEVCENLTVVICEKLKTENPEELRVTQLLKGYRDLFSSLSKDTGALQDAQIKGLRRAIEVSASDSDVSVRLDAKLEKMENRPAMVDLLEL